MSTNRATHMHESCNSHQYSSARHVTPHPYNTLQMRQRCRICTRWYDVIFGNTLSHYVSGAICTSSATHIIVQLHAMSPLSPTTHCIWICERDDLYAMMLSHIWQYTLPLCVRCQMYPQEYLSSGSFMHRRAASSFRRRRWRSMLTGTWLLLLQNIQEDWHALLCPRTPRRAGRTWRTRGGGGWGGRVRRAWHDVGNSTLPPPYPHIHILPSDFPLSPALPFAFLARGSIIDRAALSRFIAQWRPCRAPPPVLHAFRVDIPMHAHGTSAHTRARTQKYTQPISSQSMTEWSSCHADMLQSGILR